MSEARRSRAGRVVQRWTVCAHGTLTVSRGGPSRIQLMSVYLQSRHYEGTGHCSSGPQPFRAGDRGSCDTPEPEELRRRRWRRGRLQTAPHPARMSPGPRWGEAVNLLKCVSCVYRPCFATDPTHKVKERVRSKLRGDL